MNAVRMHMDYRPLVGLGPDDHGTLVERVIARVVMEAAVDAHNADAKAGGS